MKKIFRNIAILVAAFTLPTMALAHVKWFAEPVTSIPPYSFTDTPVIIGILAVLAVIGLGIFFEKHSSVPRRLSGWIERHAAGALSLASIGFGLAFVIFTIGGFIFALIAAYFMSKYDTNINLTQWLILAIVIVVSGSLGDLLESKFKRAAGVKDSGAILPGHGGMLDRLDSLIFAAPFAYLTLNIFNHVS